MIVKRNIPLSNLTTLKVGGTVPLFIEIENKNEIEEALEIAKKEKLKLIPLGSGSNILAHDSNHNFAVVKLGLNKIEIEKQQTKHVHIQVGAGVIWDDLVKWSVENGYQGIECMSGIPGTVGAAPVQNIGAYGQELSEVLLNVEVYDLESNKLKTLSNKDCEFSYRNSIFKKDNNKYIILETTIRLNINKKPTLKYESLKKSFENNLSPTLRDIREKVLEIREEKFGNLKNKGSAGSFFKNPIIVKNIFDELIKKYPDMPSYKIDDKYKLFAGWLIEKSGWKGKSHKNAHVSEKNALVLESPNFEATSKDLYELASLIKKDVKEKFDIDLEPEVRFLGYEK